MPPPKKKLWLQKLLQESETDKRRRTYDWPFWARPNQLDPARRYEGHRFPWQYWLLLAGRGFGKTRVGAEAVRWRVESGLCKRIALVARTAADARDVMVEGHSGILAVSPPWFRPKYEPSKRRLTWPNGAIATTYSGDEPDLLRGPQHDFAWADELAAWRYADAWDQLKFGLRLGEDPQAVITTTPRPTKIVKEIRDDSATLITVGTTFENQDNLAKTFIKTILKKYEGTRLGQQELYAKILDDNPLALWKRAVIDNLRVTKFPVLKRIVVAIDPSINDDPESSAEAGIVVAGVTGGATPEGYVLDDKSLLGSPGEWAREAVTALHTRGADRIVAEVNQGGKMVEHTVRSIERNVPYKSVNASRGKYTRAEPIAALYEQGLVHHVGCFPELEDEMCEWVPGEKSPNRMDALVWALTELMVGVKDKSGYGF